MFLVWSDNGSKNSIPSQTEDIRFVTFSLSFLLSLSLSLSHTHTHMKIRSIRANQMLLFFRLPVMSLLPDRRLSFIFTLTYA